MAETTVPPPCPPHLEQVVALAREWSLLVGSIFAGLGLIALIPVCYGLAVLWLLFTLPVTLPAVAVAGVVHLGRRTPGSRRALLHAVAVPWWPLWLANRYWRWLDKSSTVK